MTYYFTKATTLFPTLLIIVLIGCAGQVPTDIGVTRGRLAPCPASPNCVSSMATDEQHAVKPFSYEGADRDKAHKALLAVLATRPRATIVDRSPDYLHAEFKSRLFGFVDDVEFYFPGDAPLIQVRSASRKGHSDMGVNRERVEQLRTLFTETLAAQKPGAPPQVVK